MFKIMTATLEKVQLVWKGCLDGSSSLENKHGNTAAQLRFVSEPTTGLLELRGCLGIMHSATSDSILTQTRHTTVQYVSTVVEGRWLMFALQPHDLAPWSHQYQSVLQSNVRPPLKLGHATEDRSQTLQQKKKLNEVFSFETLVGR